MEERVPKVSVIVPAYNAEKYLSECLDSIRRQTMKDIEIICVDDGSTDQTGSILESCKALDNRIIVIHQEKNGGQSKARNTGLGIACGEYIAFVDSDDFIDNEMIEKLYLSAKRFNSDIVICNINLYINQTKEIRAYRDIVQMFHLECKGAFEPLDYPNIVKYVAVWDKLFKRDFITRNGFRYIENMIYEDHLFSFQTILLAKQISIVSEPLYYYRKNVGDSITDREVKSDIHKKDFIKITKTIKEFMISKNKYKIYQKPFLEYQFEFALFHQSNISSHRFFTEFFSEMKNMTYEDDFQAIINCGLSRHKWYAERLKNNEVRECYRVLRKKKVSIYEL